VARVAKRLRQASAATASRGIIASEKWGLMQIVSKPFLLGLLLACSLASACTQRVGKHYPIQADVISVDLPGKRIVVEHGDIPGLMPAMTMSYTLAAPKEAQGLALDDKISADLVVTDGIARLEKIVLLEKAKPVPTPAPAAKP
jgi:Cu/Ag efflux protein CusF